MIMGGNSPATNTTEIIDMGAATPKWVYGLNMSQPRIEMNAAILPDGRVLAVGGSVNDEDTGSLSLKADLFDLSSVNLNSNPPNLGTVSSAGANATERLYHSVALLLPDATVWLAGGNPQRGTYNNTMEIYQPPYLFNSTGGLATRPSITSAPSSISYGNGFTLQTPDAANISSVVLVRNGAVTHAFGMDQRLVGLSFTAGSGSLTVTAPPNGNIAPPGYYMLFILNSSGVPSIARMVQLSPMVGAVSPNNGPTAGGTAVTITGTTFASGATVTFGGMLATNVVVVNSTTITATTPAGNAGAAVTVTVTNPGGQTGSLANGFTYNAAVAIGFGQVAAATPQSPTATVPVSYPGAQTLGRLERRGGGMERHDGDGTVGDGQCGEQLQSGDRADEWDGVAAIDLLCGEHRGREQHGHGDIQPGGVVPRHTDSGVPGSEHGGCDGGSEREQYDGEQRCGDDDGCE